MVYQYGYGIVETYAKKYYKLIILAVAVLFTATMAIGTFNAGAAAGYTLFGEATEVSPGYGGSTTAVQMVSDDDPAYGGVDFEVPSGLTFDNLTHLSVVYKVTMGDCGGGSPRFQINVDGHNVFVYLGPGPNFTGCTIDVWEESGDFIGSSALVFDLSQIGGPWYGSYATALSLLTGHVVTGIQLVTDGGWAVGGMQAVNIDNVVINDRVFGFEKISPAMTKLDVCHKEDKKKVAYHMINISEKALDAHMAHGDFLPGTEVDGIYYGNDCSVWEQFDSLTVDSGSTTPTSTNESLASGVEYMFKAFGTWVNSQNVSDTEFASKDNWVTHFDGYDFSPWMLGVNEFDLMIDDGFVDWGAYNDNHSYWYGYVGTGNPAEFLIFDGDSTVPNPVINPGWYGDNSGSLTVDIYRLVH